jgi:hypothetical protein
MEHDPFDLDTVRVNSADPRFQRKPGKPKNWRRQYIQFPWAWVERLQAAKRVSTYRLALLLVYEHWRTGGRPIVLSNLASRQEGLSRWSKWNALAELEELGLVRVERRPSKSPRVVVCHPPPGQS